MEVFKPLVVLVRSIILGRARRRLLVFIVAKRAIIRVSVHVLSMALRGHLV